VRQARPRVTSERHVHYSLQYLLIVSPTPSTSSAVNAYNKQKLTLMSLNQQVKEIPEWNITVISCTASTGAVTKNYL
jgi:hypothetical protein